MEAVRAFAAAGGPVLGICNGFQILTECGLLPGVLLRNRGLKFLCQDVELTVEGRATPFTRGVGGPLRLPIAHMEGSWFADAETLARVEGEGQVIFRYCQNPNGALNDVAGVSNAAGNVVGLMPQTLIVQMARTPKLPFIESMAAPPLLAMSAARTTVAGRLSQARASPAGRATGSSATAPGSDLSQGCVTLFQRRRFSLSSSLT